MWSETSFRRHRLLLFILTRRSLQQFLFRIRYTGLYCYPGCHTLLSTMVRPTPTSPTSASTHQPLHNIIFLHYLGINFMCVNAILDYIYLKLATRSVRAASNDTTPTVKLSNGLEVIRSVIKYWILGGFGPPKHTNPTGFGPCFGRGPTIAHQPIN